MRKMFERRPWVPVVCACIVLAGAFVFWRVRRAVAEGPPPTNPLYFSGVLTEAGVPADGPRDITLRLFDAEIGGTALCTTTGPGTSVFAGRFRLPLQDPDCAAAVAANPDLWIEVTIRTTTLPRMKISAVPYALEAGRASEASALAIAARREMTGVREVWNCKLAYDSTSETLSVVGRDGNPLSPTNPCFVGVADGEVATFERPVWVVLANDANTFGSTAGRAWGNDRPFFMAACDGSDPGGATNDFFGISLNPIRGSTGPDVAGMCKPGDAARCNAQNSLLVMDGGISLAGEVNRPCVVVGSFRATKSTADRWTVTSPLNPASDGIGRFQEGIRFTMPTGQNGAASGHYLVASPTGVLPVCPSVYYYYWIRSDGFIVLTFVQRYTSSTPCTAGSGTDSARVVLPYVPATPAEESIAGYAGAGRATPGSTGNIHIHTTSFATAVLEEDGGGLTLDQLGTTFYFVASNVPYHAFSP